MAVITPRTIRIKDGGEIVVRTGGPTDAEALRGLAQGALEDASRARRRPDEGANGLAKEAARFERCADHPAHLLLVAEREGRPVGVLDFACSDGDAARAGKLRLAVAEGARGLGIGRALLQTFLSWAEHHPSLETVEVGLRPSDARGILFYQNLGFREQGQAGRAMRSGPDRGVDALSMACNVKGGRRLPAGTWVDRLLNA